MSSYRTTGKEPVPSSLTLRRWLSTHGLPCREALQGPNTCDLALQLYPELRQKINELSIFILFFLGMGGTGKKKIKEKYKVATRSDSVIGPDGFRRLAPFNFVAWIEVTRGLRKVQICGLRNYMTSTRYYHKHFKVFRWEWVVGVTLSLYRHPLLAVGRKQLFARRFQRFNSRCPRCRHRWMLLLLK
ncbi:hypothetical protein CFOL_v3_06268 [Cephalotus follicularis]|uniref:Uncharacterized protein n=1 Tax=Cephalotus follicularis TaxID=3775 RepID=A0A1Q3B4E0_CEPFO|nr:hypothetical protein CFOL_v3_06268 [Cephalotus follicularis]